MLTVDPQTGQISIRELVVTVLHWDLVVGLPFNTELFLWGCGKTWFMLSCGTANNFWCQNGAA